MRYQLAYSYIENITLKFHPTLTPSLQDIHLVGRQDPRFHLPGRRGGVGDIPKYPLLKLPVKYGPETRVANPPRIEGIGDCRPAQPQSKVLVELKSEHKIGLQLVRVGERALIKNI